MQSSRQKGRAAHARKLTEGLTDWRAMCMLIGWAGDLQVMSARIAQQTCLTINCLITKWLFVFDMHEWNNTKMEAQHDKHILRGAA